MILSVGCSPPLRRRLAHELRREQLHDLAEGRIVWPRSDYEHLLQSTLHCRRTVHAVPITLVLVTPASRRRP
jgi:hypothetical protein